MRQKTEARITEAEAARAIYIDFEGFADQPPSLLGILDDIRFEQVVLDQALRLAAESSNLRMITLEAVVSELVARCSREDRRLVAYTQHEKNTIRGYAHIDLTGPYRDARLIANRWRSICHREVKIPGRGLKDYLTFIEYGRPPHLGEQKTTKRLRAVATMLAKRGTFQSLTPTVKRHWTNLLGHNRVDCEGMRTLVIRATAELSATREGRPR